MNVRQKNSRGLSIATKLLFTVFVILLILIGTQAALNLRNADQELRNDEKKSLLGFYNNYQDEIAIRENAASALSHSFSDRADIRELYQSQDRDGLLELLTPVFNTLKTDNDIVHLYVENPDGTVFVRIHNPDKFGDDVTYRNTAAAALADQNTVAGVEIGPSRLGVRSVSPLFEDDAFIGMVEVGLDYDQSFIDDLKSRSGADYRMWVTHEAAEPANLVPAEDAPESPSSEFFYYSGTNANPLPIPEDVYLRVINTGEPETIFVDDGEQELAVLLAPLLAYGERTIGIIEIAKSREADLIALQRDQTQTMLVAAFIAIVGFSLVGLVTYGVVLRPLHLLTTHAEQFRGGDLGVQVPPLAKDEMGLLGTTFNDMSTQLRNTLGNLEQRVAARTQDLTLANEVGRNVSEIRDANELLTNAVKTIHDGFNLYLAQIYLVDDDQETLLLRAAEGQAASRLLAQGHYLAITSASVNGTAVSEKRAVVVPDTTIDPLFRPNPLLPDTRSEMAVPLLVANRVIGVLDIQSTTTNTFTEENVPAFSAMAGQLAIALENAALFNEREAATSAMADVLADTEEQARQLTQLNEMGTNLAGAAKLDEVYQIIGSQILTLIEGDRASLALVTEGEESAKVFALQGKKGAIPTGSVLPFTGTAVGLAIQENRIVQLPQEYPLSTYADSRQLAQQGLQSLIVVPLKVSGQVMGTLNIGSTQPYAFSESDINFAQQIATLLASTIDSWNLVERVQSLATLVENHPDFIGIGTLTGEALYINPAGLALLGLPANFDITSMGAADFYIAEDAERLQQEGIPTALETGSWTAAVQLRKADATTIPVEQTIAINYDAEGKASNFSITMRDITERQQAEESQRRLSTQLEERLLQVNAMQRAMTHEGWSAFLTSPNRLVQGFKFNDEQIGLISTRDVAQGKVPTITSQIDGEDLQPSDLSTTAVPVDVRGQTVGVIGAKNVDGKPLSLEQSTLLNAMSQQVASALDRARLFEEMEMAREQMNALYSGSEQVVRATSVQEVLDALIEATALKRMDRANFLFFDQSWTDVEPTMLTVTAVWEKDPSRIIVPDYTPPTVGRQYSIDQLSSVRLVSKEKPALFPDVTTNDRLGPDAAMLAERLGVTSIAYFPLVVGEQWFGLLVAQSFDTMNLSEDDIRQISSLIDQAASVSQTQRLFTQAQTRARHEQLLREVGAKVYAAPDAESIMKTAVKEVNRIMGVDSFVYLDAPTTTQPAPDNGHHLDMAETVDQEG